MRFAKSSLLMKIIVLIVVVYATITLVSLRAQTAEKNAEAEQTAAEIKQTKQEIARIEDATEALETDEGIKAAAEEKLGMVYENDIIFQDIGG